MNSHQEFSGIFVEYAANADFDGNIIDSVFNAEYGICAKNLNAEGFYIRNNHVKVGESNFGIYLNASSSNATDTGYVYNNEVILYPVVAANSYAVQIKSSNFMKVANNSFYIKSDAPYSNTAALRIENNSTTKVNLDIPNDIKVISDTIINLNVYRNKKEFDDFNYLKTRTKETGCEVTNKKQRSKIISKIQKIVTIYQKGAFCYEMDE